MNIASSLLILKGRAPITATPASSHILTLGNWLQHKSFYRLWQRSLDLVDAWYDWFEWGCTRVCFDYRNYEYQEWPHLWCSPKLIYCCQNNVDWRVSAWLNDAPKWAEPASCRQHNTITHSRYWDSPLCSSLIWVFSHSENIYYHHLSFFLLALHQMDNGGRIWHAWVLVA